MRGEGRIDQRGERYYIAYAIGGRELRERTGSCDPADAQRLLVERLRRRAQAEHAIGSAVSAATFEI
jgi:hypothetical protein